MSTARSAVTFAPISIVSEILNVEFDAGTIFSITTPNSWIIKLLLKTPVLFSPS